MVDSVEIEDDCTMNVDVVIIGSGCGGSVMAAELSKTKNVLVLEKGSYEVPEEMAGTEGEAFDRMYEVSYCR